MPLYEYQCPNCGEVFEKLVRFSSTDIPHCPSCGAAQAKRLISAPARRSTGDCGPTGST
ncbi:MAG TPA: zinc ribbon domain-containing protein [Chloroflexota bacterium]|nr:zinc ribbon domain-containing protein [Chloroflexota bacterium]